MSSWRALSASMLVFVLMLSASALVQQKTTENYGVGDADVFLTKYLAFRQERLKSADPDVLIVPLGFVKGLSRSFTGVGGEASINLRTGTVSATLGSLKVGEQYSVWLVDGKASDVTSLDQSVKLADVSAQQPSMTVSRAALANLPPDFFIDRVTVARGTATADDVLASGSVNVFQKIFFRRASLTNESTGKVLFAERDTAPALSRVVSELEQESATA